MRLTRSPTITIPIDSEDYVETYAMDENGNRTEELVPYVYQETGVFAIDTIRHPELTEYKGKGTFSGYAGVKTYCYQWPDTEAYEQDFPPAAVEEELPTVEPEPVPYDLENGKAMAKKIVYNLLTDKYKEAVKEYPLFETATWDKQRLEALGEQPATIIEGQLLEGETAEEMKLTVLENSSQLSTMAGALIKSRRMLDRAIEAAETEQDISNILGGL